MLKDKISGLIDKKKDIFTDLSDRIWDHPETGLEEFFAQSAIAEILEKEGFEVAEGISGIDTAFMGTWGSGHPVIGFLGEYDALADMSQKAMSLKKEAIEECCP